MIIMDVLWDFNRFKMIQWDLGDQFFHGFHGI